MNGLGCKENQVLGLLFEQPLTVVYHPDVILISPAKFYLSQYSLYLYNNIFCIFSKRKKFQEAALNLYTWVERGTGRVRCLAQEHNMLMSLAMA